MAAEKKTSVGIVGASGYGGIQLVRLLLEHPHVEITYLGGKESAGKDFAELYPHLGHRFHYTIDPIDVETIAQRSQVVFLSLPHGLAYHFAPQLLAKGCQVLDLSADYRFSDLSTYSATYNLERDDEETVATAVYGLPELYRKQIPTASLIGCPGCYPTASLLAIAPALKQGLILPDSVIIDAKSGTSGGGRKTKLNLLLAEADSNLSPYSVAGHRHIPEIEAICSDLAGVEMRVQFTPHLVPMVRGMLTTVYATLHDPGLVRDDLLTIYNAFYRSSPFVKVLPNGVYPQTKWTMGTNLCYIGIEVDPRTNRVVIMSAIDNLMKGQAAQAVQCLNLMLGWEETVGLPQLAFYP